MTLNNLVSKAGRRIWSKIVNLTRNKTYYPKLYRAYWHSRWRFPKGRPVGEKNYYSAAPNPGAGIGHQLANWIAGYWFAKQLELRFAHIPLAEEAWETFFGLGEGESRVDELVKSGGYKKVRLPLFNEFKREEVSLVREIINSYRDQKVVFIAEQDQFYRDQYGVMEDLKNKFYAAKARHGEQMDYRKETFNIALHIRRGDISNGQKNRNHNPLMRWQDTTYFEKVLAAALKALPPEKKAAIYLFSQGRREQFPEFEKFPNVHFCLDVNAQRSFLCMVYADLLITSKSSFSYKAALLNNGIKICPRNFWHGYPLAKNWILAEEDGKFDREELFSAL